MCCLKDYPYNHRLTLICTVCQMSWLKEPAESYPPSGTLKSALLRLNNRKWAYMLPCPEASEYADQCPCSVASNAYTQILSQNYQKDRHVVSHWTAWDHNCWWTWGLIACWFLHGSCRNVSYPTVVHYDLPGLVSGCDLLCDGNHFCILFFLV